MYFKHEVASTLLSASTSSGDVIAIVKFVDGAFGLARNGEPVTGFYWRDLDRDLDDCVEALMRVSGVDCHSISAAPRDAANIAAAV